MEVLNQTPSLEEPVDVKSDSHSTRQDDVKVDSHSTKSESKLVNDVSEVAKDTDEVVKSKPLSLRDENEQSEVAATSTEGGVAKESDEAVKSKPLLLGELEGDSQDRPQDSLSAALEQISKEPVQNSGTIATGDNATPALKQEAKNANSKLASATTMTTSGVSTTLQGEPKIAGQDPENLKPVSTEPVVSTEGSSHRTAHSSSATGVTEEREGEASDTISIQDGGSSQTIVESGRERERNDVVVALSQVEEVEAAVHVQDAAAVGVLPSAPALIDFSDEAQQELSQQVASVQMTTATVVAEMSVEGTEDASRILYPRLDSIMQGN